MMESYKRFYYNDIQTLVLRRTMRHHLWNTLWGAGLVIGLMIWSIASSFIAALPCLMLFAILLSVNLILGPACEVYLQTAVQVHKLSNLRRVRTARMVMAIIRQLVEPVQGPLVAGSAPSRLDGWNPQVRSLLSSQGVRSIPGNPPPEPVQPFRPLLHRILFIASLLAGVERSIQLWFPHTGLAVVDLFLMAILMGIAIASLARWYRQIKGSRLILVNWSVLVLSILHGLAGYVAYMAVVIQHPKEAHDFWFLLQRFFELRASDHIAVVSGNIVLAGGSLFLGILGLLALVESGGNVHSSPSAV